ncbi:MAG: hypothetical protein MUO23_10590, partial [Anaerolineales bacterium]|nr:hypothetical protein [Anaerolineales bacterium]
LMLQEGIHLKDVQERPLHSGIWITVEVRIPILPRRQGKVASMLGSLITRTSPSTSDRGR